MIAVSTPESLAPRPGQVAHAVAQRGRFDGCHEAEHLSFQLRIYLVCDDDDIGKQLAEFHAVRILVQRHKNADLQDSGLIYDHGDGVALFMSQISVLPRSDRDRRFLSAFETQAGNHVMEEVRKMAGAFLVVQLDGG